MTPRTSGGVKASLISRCETGWVAAGGTGCMQRVHAQPSSTPSPFNIRTKSGLGALLTCEGL
jgi:hypothetical protein